MSDLHGSELEFARNNKDGCDLPTLKKALSELPDFPIVSEKVQQAYKANEWFTKFTGVIGACNLDQRHLDTEIVCRYLNYVQDLMNSPVSTSAVEELQFKAEMALKIHIGVQCQVVATAEEPQLVVRKTAAKTSMENARKAYRTAVDKKKRWEATTKFLVTNQQITEIIFSAFRTKLPAEAQEKIRDQLELRHEIYSSALESTLLPEDRETRFTETRIFDFKDHEYCDFTRLSVAFKRLKDDYGMVDAAERQLFKTRLGEPELNKMAQNTKVEHFRTQRLDPAVKMLRQTPQELTKLEYITTLFLLIEHIPRFEGPILMIKDKFQPFDEDTDIEEIYRRLREADDTYWRRQGANSGPAETVAFVGGFFKQKIKAVEKIKSYQQEAKQQAGGGKSSSQDREKRHCKWCEKTVMHKPSECYDNPSNAGKPRVPYYKQSKPQWQGGNNGGGKGKGGKPGAKANTAEKSKGGKEQAKQAPKRKAEDDSADDEQPESKPKSAMKKPAGNPPTQMVQFTSNVTIIHDPEDKDALDFRANVTNVDRQNPLNVPTLLDSGANTHTTCKYPSYGRSYSV